MTRTRIIYLVIAAAVLCGIAVWVVQNNNKKARLETPETIDSIVVK